MKMFYSYKYMIDHLHHSTLTDYLENITNPYLEHNKHIVFVIYYMRNMVLICLTVPADILYCVQNRKNNLGIIQSSIG